MRACVRVSLLKAIATALTRYTGWCRLNTIFARTCVRNISGIQATLTHTRTAFRCSASTLSPTRATPTKFRYTTLTWRKMFQTDIQNLLLSYSNNKLSSNELNMRGMQLCIQWLCAHPIYAIIRMPPRRCPVTAHTSTCSWGVGVNYFSQKLLNSSGAYFFDQATPHANPACDSVASILRIRLFPDADECTSFGWQHLVREKLQGPTLPPGGQQYGHHRLVPVQMDMHHGVVGCACEWHYSPCNSINCTGIRR